MMNQNSKIYVAGHRGLVGSAIVGKLEGKGVNKTTGEVIVEVDPKTFRPAEVEQWLGNPTKSKTLLGWNPTKTTFDELVRLMITSDMKKVEKEEKTKKMYD